MAWDRKVVGDFDDAITGLVHGPSGSMRLLYDLDQMIAIQCDRGMTPTQAKDTVTAIFAAAHDSPSAPLLFQRATPAEAWAALPKQQGGNDGHTDRTGVANEAPSFSDTN